MKQLLLASILVVSLLMILQTQDVSAQKTAIVGFFKGTIEDNLIKTDGDFRINNVKSLMSLEGTLNEQLTDSKIDTCKNVAGNFVLSNNDRQIDLKFDGKKCLYGKVMFVMGSFDSVGSSGFYADVQVKGRVTFMINEDSGNVSGHLFGSFMI